MRDLYQIHELAKLFGLHPDTLRYYEEKGLLHPERRENGYRVYHIQDICTLNIIRAQRELGVPVASRMPTIKIKDVKGMERFTARRATSPTPRATKTPSTMV